MTQHEYPPVSYLRAVREIVPTEGLEHFLAQAALASEECFGTSFRQVASPRTLQEQLDAGEITDIAGVEWLEAEIFPINRLRVTLFERRAIATDELNDMLTDAHARLTKSAIQSGRPRRAPSGRIQPNLRKNPLRERLRKEQVDLGLPPGIMTAPARSVVRTKHQEISGISFYSLEIDPNSLAAQALIAQRDVIDKDARSAQAAKVLFRGDFAFETPPNVLDAAFMVVPNNKGSKHDKFLDMMNAQPTVQLELRETRWDLATNTPADQESVT